MTFKFFISSLYEQDVLSYLRIVPSGKKEISILNDISGIIKPCRLINNQTVF